MTSTRAINAAAGVIHACMQQGKTLPASQAYALDSAGLLNSPEYAAEVAALRARVAELEAAAKTSRTEAIADVGDWLDENGQKDAAYLVYTVDIPAARDMRTVAIRPVDEDPIAYSLTVEALHASSGAVIEVPSRHGPTPDETAAAVRRSVDAQFPVVAAFLADEAPHETTPRPRPVPHDLPEVTP
jgi:hypothetical protein